MNPCHCPSSPSMWEVSTRWSSLLNSITSLYFAFFPSAPKCGPSVSSVSTLPAASRLPSYTQQVGHHRPEERADVPLPHRVIAERQDRRRDPAAGHLAPPLTHQPDAADRGHALGPGELLRRLVGPHHRLGLGRPLAD